MNGEKNTDISGSGNHFRTLFFLGLVFAAVLFLYHLNPRFLEIPYAYSVVGAAAIIFPIAFLIYRSKFLPKFLMLTGFFFFVWFGMKIAAVKTGGWSFPGQYVGSVNVFGSVFPFEELFFWMLFYASTITAFYKIVIDRVKNRKCSIFGEVKF